MQSKAFCDTLDGWAIYNGEVRHGSNSSGAKYGRQLKVGDTVSIMVDMVEVSDSKNDKEGSA